VASLEEIHVSLEGWLAIMVLLVVGEMLLPEKAGELLNAVV